MNEPASLFDVGLIRLNTLNNGLYIPKTLQALSGSDFQLKKIYLILYDTMLKMTQ